MAWRGRILVLVAVGGVVALFVYALTPRPIAVDLATVTRGPFEQTVDEDGKTRVRERYVVTAPIAGRVLRIALKAGDAVAVGAPLATIVSSPAPILDARTRQELEQRVGAADAALQRATAALERARSMLAQAEADLARTRALAASGVASRSRLERDELAEKVGLRDFEAAKFNEHTAEHALEEARAALASPEGDAAGADPWVIRSPVAGQVFRVVRESEGPVAIGAALLEIGDPRNLEAVIDVLSTDAVAIAVGAPARIERWGGDRPLLGRVRRIEPSAFTKVSALGVEEQRVNVVIDLVSPSEEWAGLGDGYRVDARILVFETADALKVPSSALFREGDDWKVFAAVNGRARKRVVQVLRRTGIEAMVGTGLAVGDQVVLYPGDAVADGVAIRQR